MSSGTVPPSLAPSPRMSGAAVHEAYESHLKPTPSISVGGRPIKIDDYSFSVREAKEGDAATLASLAIKTYGETFPYDRYNDVLFATEFNETRVRDEILSPHLRTFLAFYSKSKNQNESEQGGADEAGADDERMIGYMQLRTTDSNPLDLKVLEQHCLDGIEKQIECRRLYIVQAFHRCGVGSKLVFAGIAAVRTQRLQATQACSLKQDDLPRDQGDEKLLVWWSVLADNAKAKVFNKMLGERLLEQGLLLDTDSSKDDDANVRKTGIFFLGQRGCIDRYSKKGNGFFREIGVYGCEREAESSWGAASSILF